MCLIILVKLLVCGFWLNTGRLYSRECPASRQEIFLMVHWQGDPLVDLRHLALIIPVLDMIQRQSFCPEYRVPLRVLGA